MKVKTITAKLGTMRKPVEWIVYPRAVTSTKVTIQSDTRIASFDPVTGLGMLSRAGRSYFIDLLPMRGATEIAVPAGIIEMILDAQPKPGDAIGPGVYIGGETA